MTGNVNISLNSLAPGTPGCHFKTAIFNLVLLIGIFTSSNDNALRWMPWDLTDDKSTLVRVMAWCRQATNHYLSQCWPSSMSPYVVTRPQWVNVFSENSAQQGLLHCGLAFSAAIWSRRSEWIMVQVMTCFQMAPSHYLNQFWLNIKGVL